MRINQIHALAGVRLPGKRFETFCPHNEMYCIVMSDHLMKQIGSCDPFCKEKRAQNLVLDLQKYVRDYLHQAWCLAKI